MLAKDSRFEQQFVEQAIINCGPAGAGFQSELEQLQRREAANSNRCWLDLCMRVSLFVKLHSDLSCLRAAVEELALAYPDYPADQFLALLDDYASRLTEETPSLDPTNKPTRYLIAEMPKLQHRTGAGPGGRFGAALQRRHDVQHCRGVLLDDSVDARAAGADGRGSGRRVLVSRASASGG